MKKLLAIFLIFITIFSFAACSKNENTDTTLSSEMLEQIKDALENEDEKNDTTSNEEDADDNTSLTPAQDDDYMMGEVTNAVMLALSDQDIYDEVLYYACHGNVSCYIDSSEESGETNKIITDSGTSSKKAQYKFDDATRQKDGVAYYAAGNMKGVTITLQPEIVDGKNVFVLKNAIINKFIQNGQSGSDVSTRNIAQNRDNDVVVHVFGSPKYETNGTLGTFTASNGKFNFLYNRTRATVGDKFELISQLYRNSEYTIFISLGNERVMVYGQWNGTAITE